MPLPLLLPGNTTLKSCEKKPPSLQLLLLLLKL